MVFPRIAVAAAVCVVMTFPSYVLAEDLKAAALEIEEALHKTPSIDNGRRVYATCAVCHMPEGWGTQDGAYPQIAGQLSGVIIKQLADFRARNRDNPLMFPFSIQSTLGGVQEIADVAAYIEKLPMTAANGIGPGADLVRGKALYQENCVDCHGDHGQGDDDKHIPLIYGQHFNYLVRQFEWVKSGKRRNADKKMVEQIQEFTRDDMMAVLDYVSRMNPPAEKLAAPGWSNPDFPRYVRPMAR